MSNNDGPALPPELLVSIERYAVYRCYSDKGELLYIGETGNLGRRLADHVKKLWFVQVRGITLEWYADELDALNAERRAIHVEHPKYNVTHRSAKTLSSPPRRPAARSVSDRREKVADMIRQHPDWLNSKLAARCGVSVRTVQRVRNGKAGSTT